jgi:hypothetical protein
VRRAHATSRKTSSNDARGGSGHLKRGGKKLGEEEVDGGPKEKPVERKTQKTIPYALEQVCVYMYKHNSESAKRIWE